MTTIPLFADRLSAVQRDKSLSQNDKSSQTHERLAKDQNDPLPEPPPAPARIPRQSVHLKRKRGNS